MTEESIDFQPMPGEDAENGQIRHLFRVPVGFGDNIQVLLSRQAYSVTNLSVTGIAITAGSCLEFESGQIIDDAELKCGDAHFTGLRAKVIHCSVNDSGSFQFGLQWVDMNTEDKNHFEQTLGQLKERALQAQDLSEEQS